MISRILSILKKFATWKKAPGVKPQAVKKPFAIELANGDRHKFGQKPRRKKWLKP